MKRFTETQKWDDPWFRALTPSLKCFWCYIVDKCDHAGVWEVDMGAAAFFIGEAMDAPKVLKAFGERIESLSGGQNGSHAEKWRVLKFVQFQYPTLSLDCKPHGPVFAAIQKHGLQVDAVKNGVRSGKGMPKALNTLPVGFQSLQEKEKDQDKEKEKEKVAETNPLKLRVASLFSRRPTTPWSAAELRAWKTAEAVVADTSPGNWELIEAWYEKPAHEVPYRKTDMAALLNNWHAEIAKAERTLAVGAPQPPERIPENLRGMMANGEVSR